MKLHAKERNALPKSEFGMPGQRKYPMPDREHAGKAKGRAAEMEHKGVISKATEAKIDAKADRVLGKAHNPQDGMDHHEKKREHPLGHGHTNVQNPSTHEHKLRHG